MKLRDMPKLPLALIAAMFAVGAFMYSRLPARIPTHWGASGAIDAYSVKSFGSVFTLPLVTLGLYVLLWLVPYFDPKRANLIRSKSAYGIIIDLVAGLMTLVFLGTMLAASDAGFPMDKVISAGIGVMLIVIGRLMGTIERNWTMGVRYPWTVLDDVVWAKTNQLGGKLFMAAGVLALVGVVLPGGWGIALMLVPALAMLPITYVYSMRLYKQRHPED